MTGWTLLGWIAGGVVSFAAIIGAAKVVLAAIRTSARVITQGDQAFPVLIKLAKEFENNGGASIKDKIDQAALDASEANRKIDLHLAAYSEDMGTIRTAVKTVQEALHEAADLNLLLALLQGAPHVRPASEEAVEVQDRADRLFAPDLTIPEHLIPKKENP